MPELKIDRDSGMKGAHSTAAAAEQLRSETRAFGNASAKLNLQLATAAFLKAKEAFLVQTSQSEEVAPNAE